MGQVISFFDEKKKREKPVQGLSSKDLDPQQYDAFKDYVLSAETWMNEGRRETFYEGYPFVPPCEPPIPGMVWYVSDREHFGVWILNRSLLPVRKTIGRFGWNPFVRQSTAPPYEPINVSSKEHRQMLTWIVDEDGFGQFGMVYQDGYVWVPHSRPSGWGDSIK